MDIKPRLSGEGSIVTSLATVGLVVGIYQANVGPVSDVHATDAMDINLAASVRKAGWSSLVAVAALTLLARDPNILILGGAAIIVEELCYRHALMVHPGTGQLVTVNASSYLPAGTPGSGDLQAVAG